MEDIIKWDEYFNIVVLTGAGISVASGLRPFRGPNGLWNEVDVMEYATNRALKKDPIKVWDFNKVFREQLKHVEPNAAHYALAKFESKLQAFQNFTLITQNIDGLHRKAGNNNIIEMHGNVNRLKCTNKHCKSKPFDDIGYEYMEYTNCNICGKGLRHDVVLFEEDIPMIEQKKIKYSLRSCNLFIAIGTSGEVYPAAGFVRTAKSYGAKSILVNLEIFENAEKDYTKIISGKAEEILPKLFNTL